MSNAEQLKDIQLPNGFGFFVAWLSKEKDFDIDDICYVLSCPWKYQEEWVEYQNEEGMERTIHALERKAKLLTAMVEVSDA